MPEDDARLADFVNPKNEQNSEEEPVESSVEPAEATSRWVSGGAKCAECETTTRRLWRDGEAFVCPECKGW